jgi:glycine betaine/proline transport system ATP-binding protein
MSHLEIKNLYKIFGHNADDALRMSEDGVSKTEILKETGATIGVNNVSFNIEKGETFVVMGLSGSGKSTLIRCLNRLIMPTYGEVIVDGDDVISADDEKLRMLRRKKMAMVFQNFGLFPHRTIRRNVDYGLEVQGVEEEKRIKKAYEVLETVGLKGYEEQRPNELSGGMQQRVGLARALVNDPDILLMDEAFSALDPLIRNDMQDQLIELQEKMKKTIVFITHDLDEALKLGDRIAVMYDGTIVQIGTPEDILTNPANDYVKNFVENVDRSRVIKAESIMRKPRAVIDTKDGPKMALRQMEKAQISSIFVTDKHHKLKGVVDAEEAYALVEKGEKSLKSIVKTEGLYEVSPDTLITDMLPMASKSKYPIAVVDENRKLKGIIVRVSVIAGIHGKHMEGDANDE